MSADNAIESGPGIGRREGNEAVEYQLRLFPMENRCEVVWPNMRYIGGMSDGRLSGKGTYIWADKHTYTGDIRDGLRHGSGILTTRDIREGNTTYSGMWKNGRRHGIGRLTTPNSSYVGQWENGRRHGRGKQVYASGNSYDGLWERDLKHGSGIMTWIESNQVYDGGWVNDEPDGFGTHTWLSIPGQ